MDWEKPASAAVGDGVSLEGLSGAGSAQVGPARSYFGPEVTSMDECPVCGVAGCYRTDDKVGELLGEQTIRDRRILFRTYPDDPNPWVRSQIFAIGPAFEGPCVLLTCRETIEEAASVVDRFLAPKGQPSPYSE